MKGFRKSHFLHQALLYLLLLLFFRSFSNNRKPQNKLRKPNHRTMSGVGPISQDWEPVVLRKKAPTAAAKKDEKAVNAARRAGADIDTVKKCSF